MSYVGCKACNMHGWRGCEMHERLDALAANLAIGAALCASFDLGLYNHAAADVHPSVN